MFYVWGRPGQAVSKGATMAITWPTTTPRNQSGAAYPDTLTPDETTSYAARRALVSDGGRPGQGDAVQGLPQAGLRSLRPLPRQETVRRAGEAQETLQEEKVRVAEGNKNNKK